MPSIKLEPGGEDSQSRPAPKREQVPPPAKLPPGVTSGSPPLPIGRAVRVSLTPKEKRDLQTIGWEEGMPIPPDAAAQIAAAEAAMRETTEGNLPPPVAPGTPPVSLNTVDIDDLPQARQAQVRRELTEALKPPAGAPKRTVSEQMVNHGQAVEEIPKPPPEVAQKVLKAKPIDMAIETPSRPATRTSIDPDYDPPAPSPVAEKPPTQQQHAELHDMGADAPFQFCPHCGWDMRMQDIAEPSHGEKMAFLASMLGGVPFTHSFELMGGQLVVTFRTLTTQEIDEIYRHAYRERENGIVISDPDFWERVNRLRLYLQIFRVRTNNSNREMPSGLSQETNPNADSFWEMPANVERSERLSLVEKYLLKNVLANESVNRVVQIQCNRFNRLVSKMEAMVDNTDFWKATEQLS